MVAEGPSFALGTQDGALNLCASPLPPSVWCSQNCQQMTWGLVPPYGDESQYTCGYFSADRGGSGLGSGKSFLLLGGGGRANGRQTSAWGRCYRSPFLVCALAKKHIVLSRSIFLLLHYNNIYL